MTDEEINALITLPKTLPKGKWYCHKELHGILRMDVSLNANSDYHFILKGRQSIKKPGDFSVILFVRTREGKDFNLIRCNGAHDHRNDLEKEFLPCQFHIHKATKRYIDSGAKPEKYATSAEGCYNTYDGALAHLIKIANIIQPETEAGQSNFPFSE